MILQVGEFSDFIIWKMSCSPGHSTKVPKLNQVHSGKTNIAGWNIPYFLIGFLHLQSGSIFQPAMLYSLLERTTSKCCFLPLVHSFGATLHPPSLNTLARLPPFSWTVTPQEGGGKVHLELWIFVCHVSLEVQKRPAFFGVRLVGGFPEFTHYFSRGWKKILIQKRSFTIFFQMVACRLPGFFSKLWSMWFFVGRKIATRSVAVCLFVTGFLQGHLQYP